MKSRWVSAAMVSLAIVHVGGAQTRTFHVAPNGNDSNSGAPDAPMATIQKAAEVARQGDTVLIHSGLYKGLVLLRFSGEPTQSPQSAENRRRGGCWLQGAG
jgi:hypothetical protein